MKYGLILLAAAPFLSGAVVPLDYAYTAQKLVGDGVPETTWEGIVTTILCPAALTTFGIASEDCTISLFKGAPIEVQWLADSAVWELSTTLTFDMEWTATGGSGSVATTMTGRVAGNMSGGTATTWENFLNSQMCPQIEAALNLPTELCTEANFKQAGVESAYVPSSGRWLKRATVEYVGTAEVSI